MIEVHAYKNVKQKNAKAKLQGTFVHQNSMVVIHVVINNKI